MNVQEMTQWLQKRMDGLESLIAADGEYIRRSYFQGKLNAYYEVMLLMTEEDGE